VMRPLHERPASVRHVRYTVRVAITHATSAACIDHATHVTSATEVSESNIQAIAYARY